MHSAVRAHSRSLPRPTTPLLRSPSGPAEDLLALPELTDILLYHVAGAAALSTGLLDGQMVTTLNGADATVSIECDGSIFINDAQVIVADIEADNGVVHVIDAVLDLGAHPEQCLRRWRVLRRRHSLGSNHGNLHR